MIRWASSLIRSWRSSRKWPASGARRSPAGGPGGRPRPRCRSRRSYPVESSRRDQVKDDRLLATTTVCPALFPPWTRTTTSANSVRRSTIFLPLIPPLHSDDHDVGHKDPLPEKSHSAESIAHSVKKIFLFNVKPVLPLPPAPLSPFRNYNLGPSRSFHCGDAGDDVGLVDVPHVGQAEDLSLGLILAPAMVRLCFSRRIFTTFCPSIPAEP